MTVRIHFAGLRPGRPLEMIAWAAYAHDPVLAGTTTMHFGRELAEVFDRHWSVAPRMDDSDVVVYPHSYEDGQETAAVAELARRAGKPCLFFSLDERLPPSRLSYGTLYRGSIFTKLPHERCHPAFIYDVKAEAATAYPAIIDKQSVPRIGFCGYVGTPLGRTVLRLLGARQKVDGLAFRARVLQVLEKDQRIECDFIARTRYLGAAPLAVFQKAHPLASARDVFLKNLFENPYALAMRGKGNHSVRFYEILAAGRIPVFVNTGCVLPLEDEVDWRAHAVWIEDHDLSGIGDHVLEFHRRIEPEVFVDLQHRIRRLWETRLTPEPYFRHLFQTVASGARAP